MHIDEKNRILASSYEGAEKNFWFQGRFNTEPHDENHEKRIQWFREARIGFFPHWSPMAVIGRGGAVPFLEHLPPEENRRICEEWYVKPDFAKEWCDLALQAGARYIIFTTNHCDGLKMWDSKVSDFNSLKVGPKRDLIRESIDAAHEAGLRVGLYYSPSEPYAHLDKRYIGDDQPAADRDDFTHKCATTKPEWAKRFRERIYAEMEELLTQYGPIDIWWNDGPQPPEILPPDETLQHLRSLMPDMLINDRIVGGPGLPGDFATQDYNESPHHGQKIGQPGRDWETGMPINGSWSYIPEARLDTARLRDLLHVLQINVAEQGNLLLSVAPKGDGSVDDIAEFTLRQFGQWTRDHAEAVYGHFLRCMRITNDGQIIKYMSKGPSKCAKWALKDDTTAYLWVKWWPGSQWPIGNFQHTVKKITLIQNGQDIPFKQTGPRVEFFDLPEESPDRVAHYNILKIEFEPEGNLT